MSRHHPWLFVLNDYQCHCGCHFSMKQGTFVLLDQTRSSTAINRQQIISVIGHQLIRSKVPSSYVCDLDSLRARVRSRFSKDNLQSFDLWIKSIPSFYILLSSNFPSIWWILIGWLKRRSRRSVKRLRRSPSVAHDVCLCIWTMEPSERKRLRTSIELGQSDRHRDGSILPVALLTRILSYLTNVDELRNCLLVNKQWNSAASQPLLWKKFVKKEFGDFFDENGDCNWFEVYKNFHQLTIQDDSWLNIDNFQESVRCPFCQTERFAVEEDGDYYIDCQCHHHFRINVFTTEHVDRANKNYHRRYDPFN